MFKKGDVVYYCSDRDEVGVVDRPHEDKPGHVWVNWTGGPDCGQTLHCGIDDLVLLPSTFREVEPSVTEYNVATLKKLLDKMDDNIVFSFSDLKIHFNQKVA